MSGTEKRVANPYYTFGVLYLSPNFSAWEASKGPRFKAYRKAWAERAMKLDHGDFPLNLNIEVTTRCNLACTFCTQPSLTDEQLGDMPWELYARVIDEAERYQTPAANLNGLGEPMLLRHLPMMIQYAKERGFIDMMFHTNGMLMPEATARALIEAGLDRIIFSVDSPDKQTYEAMRIKGQWERVVENVRNFAALRNKMGRAVPIIRTTMVMTEKTVHQVNDFLALWKPVADQVTLQDLTWRTKLLEKGQWSNREKTAVSVELDLVREEAVRRKVSFVCPYLYQSTYAFWNGDVIPCSNPNARKHMVMGRLDDQNLHDIWHGKTYAEMRKLHARGRWHEHPVCRDCEIPVIELYKALEKDGVHLGRMDGDRTPSEVGGDMPVERLPVASELAPRDGSIIDLVTQFRGQAESAASLPLSEERPAAAGTKPPRQSLPEGS